MTKTYRVLGMTCDGCANSVTKAIESSVPGARVRVNLEAKKVADQGIEDDHAVEQAIRRAGFAHAAPAQPKPPGAPAPGAAPPRARLRGALKPASRRSIRSSR